MGNGQSSEDEVRENFPKFLWVIRDFMLSLETRKGEKMSAK